MVQLMVQQCGSVCSPICCRTGASVCGSAVFGCHFDSVDWQCVPANVHTTSDHQFSSDECQKNRKSYICI